MRELEAEEDDLEAALAAVEAEQWPDVPLPSVEALKARARELFATLVPGSPEVARMLGILIPGLKAYPY